MTPGRIFFLGVKYAALYLCGMEITDLKNPTMIWGYQNPGRTLHERTRTSNTLTILNPGNVDIGDNVFINHFSVIDGRGAGVTVEEGCQIGAWVRIAAHPDKSTRIGRYTFLSVGVTVEPGVSIGMGALIGVNAVVRQDVPDFGFMNSAGEIIGDTRTRDERDLAKYPELRSWYEEWQRI